jgi:hypothetical protein
MWALTLTWVRALAALLKSLHLRLQNEEQARFYEAAQRTWDASIWVMTECV